MHKIYTCNYFAIWSKYTHISKSIFNLRSYANSVHISILKVTLDQLYFDSGHVHTVSWKTEATAAILFVYWVGPWAVSWETIWENQRSREWWTDIVKGTFSDNQWMENFRITKATYEILCDDLRPSFPDQARSIREPLQLDHRVAIAVYWMASSPEYRTIANLFGVGKSTVHKCINDVCTSMAVNILDRYVKFPVDDDLQHVIDGFDNTWGFPNCAGAVNGTHIPIIAPESAHGDYVNRKGWYSIIPQAVCDHNYIIIDMNVGWPGRAHDARAFGNSELYYKGETNDLFLQKTKKLVVVVQLKA